jgi:hypothetical protein
MSQRIRIGSSQDKSAIKKWRELKRLHAEADKERALKNNLKQKLLSKIKKYAVPNNPHSIDYMSINTAIWTDSEELVDNTDFPEDIKSEARTIIVQSNKISQIVAEIMRLSDEYNAIVKDAEYYR